MFLWRFLKEHFKPLCLQIIFKQGKNHNAHRIPYPITIWMSSWCRKLKKYVLLTTKTLTLTLNLALEHILYNFSIQMNSKNIRTILSNLSVQIVLKFWAKLSLSVLINFESVLLIFMQMFGLVFISICYNKLSLA